MLLEQLFGYRVSFSLVDERPTHYIYIAVTAFRFQEFDFIFSIGVLQPDEISVVEIDDVGLSVV